jgi:hypothetical protein
LTTIDFARALQDAKGASMEALPIGDYDVEVAKSEATTSSNGKPMIKVTMKVTAGPYEKRSVLNQFVMSQDNPVALSIFFRHMKAFGLTEDWFMALGAQGSLEPVANALVGRRARLTLGHREWQGETRNEVKAVKPYTGVPGLASAGPTGPSGLATGGLIAPPAPVAPPSPVAAPIAPPAAPTPPPAVATAAPVAAPVAAPQPPSPPPVPPTAPAVAPVMAMPTPPTVEAPVAVPTTAVSPEASPSATASTASQTPTPATATSEPTPPPEVPGTQNLPF